MSGLALDIETFWQATADGILLLRQCADCGRAHFYPRVLCPACHSERTAWIAAAGIGVVYSYTHIGRGEAARTPALVALSEGIAVPGPILGADFGAVNIGAAVRLTFEPHDGAPPTPAFVLA